MKIKAMRHGILIANSIGQRVFYRINDLRAAEKVGMKTPIKIFDLRDTIISYSLLQISNFFSQMVAGQVIEIIGCDEGIAQDLRRILAGSENEALFSEKGGPHDAEFSVWVTKQP